MIRICKFLIVILFFSIATECVGADRAPGLNVVIPDPNLELAIREAIGKAHAPIYVKDLEGLTELNAQEKGIVDITGLEYCTNLEVLNLGGHNKITDISPLSQLVNLEWLNLEFNEITDISPLSKLVNLKVLDLGGRSLNVRHNWITDISPLSQLVNLKVLDLAWNEITDIAPLVRNAGLSKGDEVDLAGNPLSKESRNVYIPELRQRGVFVRFY